MPCRAKRDQLCLQLFGMLPSTVWGLYRGDNEVTEVKTKQLNVSCEYTKTNSISFMHVNLLVLTILSPVPTVGQICASPTRGYSPEASGGQ